MWNETDLDDQFIPEHLVNHLNPRQKENGEFGHVGHVGRSHDNLMESQQSHLLGVPSHDMLTDAMLGHIHSGERDREQVTQAAGRPALYCTVLYCTEVCWSAVQHKPPTQLNSNENTNHGILCQQTTSYPFGELVLREL